MTSYLTVGPAAATTLPMEPIDLQFGEQTQEFQYSIALDKLRVLQHFCNSQKSSQIKTSDCHQISSPECKHCSGPGYQPQRGQCCHGQHALKIVTPGTTFVLQIYSITIKLQKMHFMTQLSVTFHSGLLLLYVISQSWNSLSILRHQVLPELPVFLVYTDASGIQDCAAVFGSQWLQWQWPSEKLDTGAIEMNYSLSFLLAYLTTISISNVIMQVQP